MQTSHAQVGIAVEIDTTGIARTAFAPGLLGKDRIDSRFHVDLAGRNNDACLRFDVDQLTVHADPAWLVARGKGRRFDFTLIRCVRQNLGHTAAAQRQGAGRPVVQIVNAIGVHMRAQAPGAQQDGTIAVVQCGGRHQHTVLAHVLRLQRDVAAVGPHRAGIAHLIADRLGARGHFRQDNVADTCDVIEIRVRGSQPQRSLHLSTSKYPARDRRYGDIEAAHGIRVECRWGLQIHVFAGCQDDLAIGRRDIAGIPDLGREQHDLAATIDFNARPRLDPDLSRRRAGLEPVHQAQLVRNDAVTGNIA